MLITKVKVGHITNLSEARYCAGMGVDLLSFPVSGIDPKTYQEITGWVAGPVFGIEVGKENMEAISQYEAGFVQVEAEFLNLVPGDKKVIVGVNAADWSRHKSMLIAAKERILYLELRIDSLDFTESVIKDAANEFQVLLKSSLTLDIDSVLKLSVAGISLEGNSEEKPGLKEYPLSEILEKLEQV